MSTILVTGGAGFIGSCFVRQSLATGERRMVNLDNLTYAGNLDSLRELSGKKNHVFVRADIGDHQTINRLLERPPGAR